MTITRLNPVTKYHKGDTVYVNYCGGGFVTSGRTAVYYTIPFDLPIGTDVTGYSWSNIERYEIWQNGSYLVSSWSSATSRTYAPTANGLRVGENYSSLGGTNNDTVAIWLVARLTFT